MECRQIAVFLDRSSLFSAKRSRSFHLQSQVLKICPSSQLVNCSAHLGVGDASRGCKRVTEIIPGLNNRKQQQPLFRRRGNDSISKRHATDKAPCDIACVVPDGRLFSCNSTVHSPWNSGRYFSPNCLPTDASKKRTIADHETIDALPRTWIDALRC